jgi:hypothetical protein
MADIPQNVADQAAAVQDTLNRTVAALRVNADLTMDGRTRQFAVAYQRATQDMEQVQASFEGSSATTVSTLTKDIFGEVNVTGADAISVRDAADRASRLETAEDAAALLDQADNNGDDVLARAVAQRAYQCRNDLFGNDWAAVVDTYAVSHPEVGQRLSELESAQRTSLMNGLTAAWTFSLAKPPELNAMSDTAIARMAAEPATGATQ